MGLAAWELVIAIKCKKEIIYVVYKCQCVLESQTWQHDLTLCKQGGHVRA